MSRRTTLIVTLAIVVLAVVAYIIVRNLPEEEFTPIVSDRITHLNVLSSEIQSVKLDRGNGDIIELERIETEVDGKKKSDWHVVQPELAFTPRATALGDIGFNMSNIYSEKVVEEEPKDLAIYGLDAPIVHAVIKTADEVVEITVGAMSPTGVSYYVQVNGEDTVYTMRKYTIDKMLVSVDEFRTMTIPVPDIEALTYFRVKNTQETEIIPFDSNLTDDLATLSSFRVVKPYRQSYPIDSQRFQETLETIPESFTIVKWIEDDPADLAKYGLADPRYELELSDGETSLHMLFGGEADEATAYAKLADEPQVFTLAKYTLEVLQVTPFKLTSKFLQIVDIKYVDSFTISRDGERYTSRIDYTNYIEASDEGAVYYINDLVVDEDPYKDFYQTVIGLLTDAVNPDPKPFTRADVTVEFNLNGKAPVSYSRLDLVEVNKDFYAAYKNGISEFLLSDYQVEAMFRAAASIVKELE